MRERARLGGMQPKLTLVAAFVAVLAVIATLFAPFAGHPGAWAGEGSLVSGAVWADTDRDGLRDSGEPARAGVTVVLVDAAGEPVAGFSTTTGGNGAYSFANVPDGDYRVRVDAPGAFVFGTAGGDNDFTSTGTPAPNDPQRGATAPFTVAGASQHTGLDAGMRPISTLAVRALPDQDPSDGTGCEGFLITTGGVSADFDTEGTDGQGGVDRSGENCFVRTGDTVMEDFGVELTDLPENGEVDNVIVEFTVDAIDGAELELVGPNASGLPAGCLAAGQGGANPGSSVRTDPATGDITIICNVGSLQNELTTVQVSYRHQGDTAIPSSAVITARAYAAGGDAGASQTVAGPEVFVTGRANWEVAKSAGDASRTQFATIGGERVQGMFVQYRITVQQPEGSTGNGALEGWFDFTDQMTQFPNAILTACGRVGGGAWNPTCELNTPAGVDGWDISIDPLNDGALTRLGDQIYLNVFIPATDLYPLLDPGWQPGDDRPTGTLAWENHLTDTDGWAMNGGELNNGDGFETGWDGSAASGNNVVGSSLSFTDPEWDLAKGLAAGPTFVEEAEGIPGVADGTTGYEVWYNLNVTETNGAMLAPFIDDVKFNDFMSSHPNAILVACRTNPNGASTGTTSCETGQQDADGWEIHFDPSEEGINRRQGLMQVRFFIPMEEPEFDPCVQSSTERLIITNEAHDTEGWTAGGDPINPDSDEPGTEPGWGADEIADDVATGNNVATVDRRINDTVTPAYCGTLTGNKVWEFNPTLTWPGRQMGTSVALNASSDRVTVKDPMVCDVFDVSMLYIGDVDWYGPDTLVSFTAGGGIDRDDFVVEYAVGPNVTETQAVPPDVTSLEGAARTDCGAHDGEWFTDPRDYGDDWQDHINMIRVRPIEWGLEAVGPFSMGLRSQLITRGVYNGGPNAGEPIPDRVRVTNVGSWADRDPETETLQSVTRTVPFQGARLAVGKTVTPTQYFPGDRVIWDLNMQITAALPGTHLTDLRLVDTLPVGMSLDVQCTQDRLPDDVDVAINLATRSATFFLGDVVTTTSPHWVVHPTAAGAIRLQVCATVGSVAAPGDRFTNQVQGFSNETPDSAIASSTIQVIGPGQLGIEKGVDKPYVASGEEYTWNLDWANTSTTTPFTRPDIIDVLPWNGDNQPGSGSQRTQYGSDFEGVAELVGALEQPTYTRGGTGVGDEVPGTWYYTTAEPSTLSHDARNAANANPAAAGGLWLTEAEVTDFADVTGIRFVSDTSIPARTRVRALIPAVSTTDALDVWYVNRGTIYTPTSPNTLLLSNEPVVQIPGFSLGDLVWIDHDADGRYTEGVDDPVGGAEVEVIDADGEVVGTATTDENGRWQVSALPAGTYRARIPASQFQPGGPLDGFQVKTVGSSDAEDENEGTSNSNTETPDPAETGLVSSPVTLAYVYEGEGDAERLIGANGPTDDDVANLAPPRVAAEFTNFTVDLALAPAPRVDIEKATNGEDADEPTGPTIPVGGPVTWTYVVTNTGSTELFDVTVTDDKVEAALIDCDGTGSNVVAGPLAIGASFECVATGVATAGQYANLGTVVGRGPLAVDENGDPLPPEEQDPPVSDEDWSHYLGAEPELDLDKVADASGVTGVGDLVVYRFTLTNTGLLPVTDAEIVDPMPGLSELVYSWPGEPGVLAPGESATATATYAVTQSDVDAGGVENTAFAIAEPPVEGQPPVESPEVTAEVDLPPAWLAHTGVQIGAGVTVGVLLLATGVMLFLIRRRRPTR